MTRFAYKAYTVAGTLRSGDIEAPSKDAATAVLIGQGLVPFELRTARGASLLRLESQKGRRPKIADYGSFAHQMANLLDAGMPIDHALKFVAASPGSTGLKAFVSAVVHDVNNGITISTAIARHADDAPAYFANILQAGEARGRLGDAFSELAELIDTRLAIRDKLRGALTYPLILAAAAIVTLAIVTLTLAPALLPLFTDAAIEPPFALRVALWLSSLFSDQLPLLLLLTCGVAISIIAARRSQRLRRVIHPLRLRLPFWGSFEQRGNTAIFAHTLGTMVRAGSPLPAALDISGRVTSNDAYIRDVNIIKDRVVSGELLSKAMSNSILFPKIATRLIAVGEETGRLDEALGRLARTLDRENEQSVDQAMTLLGPALTILIGGAIGGLVLSIMNATLSVNDLIFK